MRTTSQRPVVLVDDDQNDLVLLRRKIEQAGVRNPVLTFVRSEDALAFLQSVKVTSRTHPEFVPCVMFVDLKMPKLNGFELIKFTRAQKELERIEVVITSDSEEPKDKAQAATLGVNRFLTKVPSPQVLSEIILTALKG